MLSEVADDEEQLNKLMYSLPAFSSMTLIYSGPMVRGRPPLVIEDPEAKGLFRLVLA